MKRVMIKIILLIFCTSLLSAQVMARPASQKNTQTVSQSDWGEQLALVISLLYKNPIDNAGPKPNYNRGILLTAFEQDNDYWLHPVDINRLSLTYSQYSIATRPFGPVGVMFWPGELAPENTFPLAHHCGFPVDAVTSFRSDSGCGEQIQQPDSGPCQPQGIYTAAQWIAKYGATSDVDFLGICGFLLNGSDADNTAAAKAITDIILTSNVRQYSLPMNEYAIFSWPQDDPKQVPVMGFFYLANDFEGYRRQSKHRSSATAPARTRPRLVIRDAASALALAKAQQLNYYNLTNLFAPIIQVNGLYPDVTYKFNASDQNPAIPQTVNILAPR